jgi:hypothetical protein
MLEAAPDAAAGAATAAPTSVLAAPSDILVQTEQSKAAALDLVHTIKGASNIQDLLQLPVKQISAADPHVGLLYLFRWAPHLPILQPGPQPLRKCHSQQSHPQQCQAQQQARRSLTGSSG